MFKKSKQEIIEIAKHGANICLEYKKKAKGNITFEYSPESFTGTEPDFALEICNEVTKILKPNKENKLIINLPVTVSHSMPHVYAAQVEYMCKNLIDRENIIVSLHPHNDRGCAIADSEMGLLAGADRIEGTLFGNGERTGNVDIITLALNMYSQGVDPKLDFTDLPKISNLYQKVTRMRVYERQPYSGNLVFAAFSGSHQDAIAKGMKYRENYNGHWNVPYLPIDPTDIGRVYEADVIRINSQSGKGGIGYILETQFNYNLPAKMREMFGYHIKDISDKAHKELQPNEVHDIFIRDFVNKNDKLDLLKVNYKDIVNGIEADCTITYNNNLYNIKSIGNGRLDAVSNAIKELLKLNYVFEAYSQHALEGKSTSKAASYITINNENNFYYGVGVDSDISVSSIKALITAVNILLNSWRDIV